MRKKNMISNTLRSGLLMAAAATLLMTNMAVYAAEDDGAQPAGIFWENDLVAGTVTEVGSDTITVKTSGMMQDIGFEAGMPGGQGMGMPGGRADGQTPPERSEGELPDGQMPSERPEGELPSGQTPPERPEGELPSGQTPPERPEGELPDGQTPPEMTDGERPELPEGQPQGGRGMGQFQIGSDAVVSVDSDTVVMKGDSQVSLSDITAGTNVMILLDGSRAQTITIID